MTNQETINNFPYMSLSTHQGKNGLYNIVKIESEEFDVKVSPQIKNDFIRYFNQDFDKKLGGKENNVLDLNEVEYMDASGLSAVLVFNKLNRDKYQGKHITIINCNNQVERLIVISGIESIVNMVKDISKL